MIKEVVGDLFKTKTDVLVNPVNCVGIAGKGLALEFKKKYPENYELYKLACQKGFVKPGKIFVTTDIVKKVSIYNFPTKRHWYNSSSLEDIQAGLKDMQWKLLMNKKIRSISIPALGCGLGNLDWEAVKLEIYFYLDIKKLQHIEIYLYDPIKQIQSR